MAKLFALQPDRQAGGRRQLAAARMAIAGVAAGVTAPLEYYAGPGECVTCSTVHSRFDAGPAVCGTRWRACASQRFLTRRDPPG